MLLLVFVKETTDRLKGVPEQSTKTSTEKEQEGLRRDPDQRAGAETGPERLDHLAPAFRRGTPCSHEAIKGEADSEANFLIESHALS